MQARRPEGRIMRVMDTTGMRVVHAGIQWPYKDIDPSSKEAINRLERNEAVITWLQPVDGGIEDQVPAINVGDKGFYMLSLRCMKVVFRHVRLRKGFTNREYNSCGRCKLKIPMCLMREKIRTQSRFNVSSRPLVCNGNAPLMMLLFNQVLRRAARMPEVPTHQHASTSIVRKIDSFMTASILPLADKCMCSGVLPRHIDFVATEADTLRNMIDIADSEHPDLLTSKQRLLHGMSLAYDQYLPEKTAPQDQHRRETREELDDVEQPELLVGCKAQYSVPQRDL